MPSDRGTVKKTTSIKRESSRENKPSTTRKDDKDKSRSSRPKAEPVKGRDDSLSRSKERKSKDDKQKNVSNLSKEKLPSKQRIDTEKMRAINKDIANDKGKVRELLAKNRSSTELRTVSKPKVASSQSRTRTSKAPEGAPLRSQLSYRSGTTRSTSERLSKALPETPSKKTMVQSSTSKVSQRESTTHGDVDGRRKKPSEEKREPHHSRASEVQQQKPRRDRTRTRTLSPREVKIVKAPAEVAKQTPKPTIHKPLDHGDDPSDVFGSSVGAGNAGEDDYDYEDDFEDYESDFEDDVESDVSDEVDAGSDSDSTESDIAEETPRPVVEEEKKLDSGNYDLSESKKRDQQEIKEVREAVERENSALAARGRVKEQLVQRVVAADEGFEEDDKPDESSKPTVTTFINFTNAKKRMLEKKLTARARRRGEQLLDMIRLDVMSFSLFELSPMPYELFMKSYGRSNTTQVHVQTNEDNLSEEIQTDRILMKNKWTQKPVTFHANTKEDPLATFSRDRLGVGGDNVSKDADSWKQRVRGNAHRLNEFLSSAGQVVLRLLESSSSGGGSHLTTSEQLPAFSNGYLSVCAEDVPFLAGRPVTLVRFPPHSASTLLTVHATAALKEDGELDALLDRCMICIWSLLAPSSPQAILISSQEVTAACFEPTSGCLVLGGLSDGSVCVWDLREPASNHRLTRTGTENRALRSPTYSTAEILRNEGHLTEVVALQPLMEPVGTAHLGELSEVSPIQVCSLEEAGTLIVWTLLQSFEQRSALVQQDLGLAHWGRVRLVRTTTICLSDSVSVDLQCVDLQVDGADPNHLYVSTTAGVVVHCLRNGGKPRPRLYTTDAVEGFSVASCLESCPFSQPFFLVGCEDGAIRLHSRWSDKPLTTLAGTGDAPGRGAAVRSIQWSAARPGIFFVLDNQSRVHIWDMGESDIHPVQTVELDKKVTAMQLSPHLGVGKGSQHLALSTSCGQVQVHKLKGGLSYQSPALFTEELERFLLYASAS
ncbi:cytoplasmic dynein 2 intermediate chain 1 [Anabrus simplex]|uniref:cytoplasmic dynein 2 intermediate chain 1 n=1 Tax=Anabrus simplex TaxID=316456 RepID=UPI0035A34861